MGEKKLFDIPEKIEMDDDQVVLELNRLVNNLRADPWFKTAVIKGIEALEDNKKLKNKIKDMAIRDEQISNEYDRLAETTVQNLIEHCKKEAKGSCENCDFNTKKYGCYFRKGRVPREWEKNEVFNTYITS